MENEKYVLIDSPLYNGVRRELMTELLSQFQGFENIDIENKLRIILSDNNIVKLAAKTCFLVLKKRKKHISCETN